MSIEGVLASTELALGKCPPQLLDLKDFLFYQLTVMRFNFTQLTTTSIAIACFTTRQVEMCRRLLSGLAFLATSVDYYDIIGE
jgi:hypothetical protein